ncbi:MAG: hypothetical protein B7Z66_14590 [Chromatiales bacterium 21-64-14]|nr:MAG: hypothetical protein B7Z66_14590 [Chromatiales bacterium 21-64-14]
MKTECTADRMEFHGLGRRVVVGRFDGGRISSDGGGLLLREVEQRTQILKRLAVCFTDYRDAGQVEHSVESLIKQRMMGLALGYEDLNDHDRLCHDPLLAVLSDKRDVLGKRRKRDQDKGCALAGKSTLNRLELTSRDADAGSRYKKIVADPRGMDDPSTPAQTVGGRLTARRRSLGGSVKETARRLGVDEGAWASWEAGRDHAWAVPSG